MRRTGFLFLLALIASGQDGGRDSGKEGKVVLFVRWQRLLETGEIYRAAWSALEPHFGVITRRRILEFDGDPERARRILSKNTDAVLVVALDERSAAAARESLPGATLVQVTASADALVETRADRRKFARLARWLDPRAKKIAHFGPEEKLTGFVLKRCRNARDAAGCDLAWIAEGAGQSAAALRPALDKMGIPLLSTSSETSEGVAALKMRPDAGDTGRRVASSVLSHLRDQKPLQRAQARRMRIVLDLDAARAAGSHVSLDLLARVDVLRRRK